MRIRVGSVPGKIIAGQLGVTLVAAALFRLASGADAAFGEQAGRLGNPRADAASVNLASTLFNQMRDFHAYSPHLMMTDNAMKLSD